jgi:hypothetical protein
MSFSALVSPSVLTMSFPAPCAVSAHPPGMLTCMSCSSVEFVDEKWESVCHFIPKISSSVAHTEYI